MVSLMWIELNRMKLLYNPRIMTFDFVVPNMPATEGVQKIAGFSRGWHHWNSVRLGIRKENDYCVLYLYAYVSGKRIIKRIGKVAVGSELSVVLRFTRRFVSASFTNLINTEQSRWHYFDNMFTFPIGYQLGNYAEEDYTGARITFKCEVGNVVVG